MLGNPKYTYGDLVTFKIDGKELTKKGGKELTGKVVVIDRYGTFMDDSDVSYDVFVESEGSRILYKHIREDFLL